MTLDPEAPVDSVFRHLKDQWWTQIEHAIKRKKELFGAAADEASQFFNGPKDWKTLMGESFVKNDNPNPTFQVCVNKAFEFVTIFGPALYYENPVRTVKPRVPVDIPPEFFPPDGMFYEALLQQEQARIQMDGIKATLLGAYLNWTPHEFKLAEEARQAINEALIKGRSCLWTELYNPPGADFTAVRTYFDSVDNLIVDPDACSFSTAKWIARRCVHPAWQVERDYGITRGTLKPNAESQAFMAQLESSEDARDHRKMGLSNDLIVYWKVWSKMGIGGRLPGVRKELRPSLDVFGDYCHFAVCAEAPYFLNLPPHKMNDPAFTSDQAAVFGSVAWPTPFWAKDEWPVSVLDFHPVAGSPWPSPHLKAGMGELRFLNWATSFLLGHIRTASRTIIAMRKSLDEETKATVMHGEDQECVELDTEHGRIDEIVQFLKHPEINGEFFKIIQMVESNFDKRVGLTELMYGNTEVQLRSAAEANIKNQNMNVRPADMAKQVETWMAQVASLEAMCARFHLIRKDIQPVLGIMGAFAWDQYVGTKVAQVAARELEYQIEAGSTQKPNKQYEQEQMAGAMQALVPIFQDYENRTGDVTPMNNLLSDYAKSIDLDPARYQLQQMMGPPIPESPPMPQSGGGTESSQQVPTSNPVPQG